MAIADLGSPYVNTAPDPTAGAKSHNDVTIPSNTTLALLAFYFYDNSSDRGPSTTTAPTLDGQTCVLIGEAFDGSTGGYGGTQLWRCAGMSAGSGKTLTYTNDGGVDDGDMALSIAFLSGTDTGAPRGTDTDFAAASNTAVTATGMSFSAGDWAVGAYISDDTAIPSPGTALVAEFTSTGGVFAQKCGMYYRTDTGTIGTAATADNASIVGATIIPDAGAASAPMFRGS